MQAVGYLGAYAINLRERLYVQSRSGGWMAVLSLALAFALVTGLLAQVRVYLPFTPVPVTGQTLAVLLAGTLLGARTGALSMGLYLLLGLVGIPWFSGANGGLNYALGPTGGYLLGFIAAAWFAGLLAGRGGLLRRPALQLAVMSASITIVYAFGVIWLSACLHVGLREAVLVGVVPFIAGDAFKVLLAGAVGSMLLPGRR